MREGVKLESIFHPSDFSEGSEVAFAHALKIALVAGAKLTMLHVEANPSAEWQDFPGVRNTLERWGLIPHGSPKRAVGQLGIPPQMYEVGAAILGALIVLAGAGLVLWYVADRIEQQRLQDYRTGKHP